MTKPPAIAAQPPGKAWHSQSAEEVLDQLGSAATSRGADVMKPIALPSLGGMSVSVVTMFIVPCLFCAIGEWKWKRAQRANSNRGRMPTALAIIGQPV